MAQPGAVSGPRRLLRRLRDVMAGPASAQDRLDKIVRIIAGDMVAEVCSCYVMRAGEVLELVANPAKLVPKNMQALGIMLFDRSLLSWNLT